MAKYRVKGTIWVISEPIEATSPEMARRIYQRQLFDMITDEKIAHRYKFDLQGLEVKE